MNRNQPSSSTHLLCLSLGLCFSIGAFGFDTQSAYIQLGNNPAAVVQSTQQHLEKEGNASPATEQLPTRLLLVDALWQSGMNDQLDKQIQRGISAAQAAGDNRSLTRFLLAQARQQMRAGKPELTETWREIGVLSATENDPLLLADVYSAKAEYLAAQGLRQEALERAIYAYRAYEQGNQRYKLPGLLLQIAAIQIEQGDLEDAFYYLSQVRDLNHDSENAFIQLRLAYLSGQASRKQGQLPEAERQQLKALAIAETLGHSQFIAKIQYELGQLQLSQSKLDAAEKHLQIAEKTSQISSDNAFRLRCQLALADLHTRRRDPQALKYLEQAAQFTHLLNTDPEAAAYENQAATTLAEFGRWNEAYQHARNFARLLQSMIEAKASATRSELQAQFQGQRKEAENALLRNQQKLKDLQLSKQQAERQQLVLALTLAAILVGAIVTALMLVIRQRRRLHVLAMKDELTGVSNRRSILAYAEHQLRQSGRKQQPLMVAVLDLDHFKQINDSYGHQVGDLVLRAFASAIQSQLRGADRIGRIGGEEWLLILPGLRPEIVQPLFERLQNEAKAIRVNGIPETRLITFSMGMTTVSGDDKTLDEIVARADEALYQAKSNGRDCMRLVWRSQQNQSNTAPTPPAASS